MRILFVEPYCGGSHKNFLVELKEAFKAAESGVHCHVIELPPRHWRWRMQGAHFELANTANLQFGENPPDIIVGSSLMDTAAFRGLLSPALRQVPLASFFHENQMAYPINTQAPNAKELKMARDFSLSGIHLNQALASERLIFNSRYNYESFFEGLEKFLKKMPDTKPLAQLEKAKEKSHVLGLGARAPSSAVKPWEDRPARLLWNHRWEFDKNPQEFIKLFCALKASLPELEVDLLGCDHQGKSKEVFADLKNNYPQAVTYYGEVPKRSDYYNRLQDCRLLAVTSLHDFFGLSVAEAIFHGVIPLLPRRLAYPELIPPRLHSKLLYNDYEELERKARSLLKSGLEAQERQELMKWMDQFRWPNIAKNFLDLLKF